VPDTGLSEKVNQEHYEAFVIDFSKTFIELLFQYFYQKDPSSVCLPSGTADKSG